MKTAENRKTDTLAAAGDFHAVEDYKEAAARLDAAFAASGLRAVARGGYLTTDDDNWRHYAWLVEYHAPGALVSFDWKAGTAHVLKHKHRADGSPAPKPPNPAEVLGRVCVDFLAADGQRFEHWAADFGYDPDIRKAERIYQECLAIGDKLRRLGLSREEIEAYAALADRL